MKVIGLTGKACAGKNVYAREFEKYGCSIVDVDLLGHEALQKTIPELIEAFGGHIVVDSVVDRKALGKLVFSDEHKLRKLESITHPMMVAMCRDLIAEAKRDGRVGLVLNAALLHRMKLDRLCDAVIYIDAPLLKRYERCRKREHWSFSRFLEREKAQKDIELDVFPSNLHVERMRNTSTEARIHRQVAMYCARIGIGVPS